MGRLSTTECTYLPTYLYKRENCRHCCLLAKVAKSEQAGLFVQIPG